MRKSDAKDVGNHEVVMNGRLGRCSVLRLYEEGEDDKYNEDGEAALYLVTQVHSERMTTVRMGRVRVLVRKKHKLESSICSEKIYPRNSQLPKSNKPSIYSL